MSIEHKDITGANMHPPTNWSFANAAARTAAGSYVLADEGKWAEQTDNGTLWRLVSFDGGGVPTWAAVGGGGASMTNPMTTLDDIIVGGASGTPGRLAVGSQGSRLSVDPVSGHVSYFPDLALPQGTYLRGYTFDTTVEGWTGETTPTQSAGQLVFSSGVNQSAVEPASPTGGTVQHGEIHCDITGPAATAYGVIWRYQDVNNYYLFDVDIPNQRIVFYKKVSGTFGPSGVSSVTFQGGTHRVLVRFVGSQFWLYINGSFVLSQVETSISAAGRVGIFGNNSVVKLDAMRVYSLSSTWAPSGL